MDVQGARLIFGSLAGVATVAVVGVIAVDLRCDTVPPVLATVTGQLIGTLCGLAMSARGNGGRGSESKGVNGDGR